MTPPIAVRKLCESATRNRAYLFTQLRAGHNWFFTYAKARQFLHDDHHWVCSAQEIIIHVLVDCPEGMELRKELRNKVRDAFNSASSLLGRSRECER